MTQTTKFYTNMVTRDCGSPYWEILDTDSGATLATTSRGEFAKQICEALRATETVNAR